MKCTEKNISLMNDKIIKKILKQETFHLILQKSLLRDKFLETFVIKLEKNNFIC